MQREEERNRALSGALYSIAEALGRAEELARPYAQFDDDGDPIDGDAEVVSLSQDALKALPLLERAVLGPEARAFSAAMEGDLVERYKDHLYHAAIEGFDEEDRALEARRRYEGALGIARALGATPDAFALEEKAEDELLEDLRREIPELRAPAAADSAYPLADSDPSPEPPDNLGRPRDPRLRLNLDEAALDALIARRRARTSPGGDRWGLYLKRSDGTVFTLESWWRTQEVALMHLAGLRAGSYGRPLGGGPTSEEMVDGELSVRRAAR